jgi:anti-sigma factor RsiW
VRGGLPPISDEDLHGFVDSEIPPDQRRDVETYLAASPAAAERVENWRRQREIIRATFARVEAEPPPPAMLLPRPQRKRVSLSLLRPCAERSADGSGPFPRQSAVCRKADGGEDNSRCADVGRASTRLRDLASAFAAGAAAALVTAFLANSLHAPYSGRPVRTSAPAGIDDSLAQRTTAALAAFKPQKGAKDSETASPSPAIDQNALVVPNLSSIGLALVGVRATPGIGGETLCLFYAKAKEATIALCGMRDGQSGAPGFPVSGQFASQSSSTTNATVISWRQGNAIYALAGPLPEARLRELAVRVSAEVAAFDAS